MKKVFLDDLPRSKNGKQIMWRETEGKKINFVYDDIEGTIDIINYKKINGKNYLSVKCNDIITDIRVGNLLNCKIGTVVGKITKEFKVPVGYILDDNNRDMIILDRKLVGKSTFDSARNKNYYTDLKYYKYKCNKCGNEDWMEESHLITRNIGCNVCCNRKSLLGVNTIYDTEPWMMLLGVSEEDAKTYSPQSNKKIKVICPNCNNVKTVVIADLYAYKSNGCTCGDGFSYGHKYMFSLLRQLKVSFNDNVKFKWCKFYNPYRCKEYKGEYDFVIENEKLIIEIDGEFHRKDNNMSGQTKEESQFIDTEKDNLAIKNGYEVVRISYDSSNIDIDSYIYSSRLSEIFDLSNVDKVKCEEFSITNNKIKDICCYWNNKEEWETSYTIGEKLSINPTIIRRYLTKGNKIGWCCYNAQEEFDKSRVRCGDTIRKKLSKSVEIFKDNISLGVFDSCVELSKVSEELYGVKLLDSKISAVASGRRKTHKGYTFKYVNQEGVA